MSLTSLNIALLFGGVSAEHAVSFLSAKNVLKAFSKLSHTLYPIFIDKNGAWFLESHDYLGEAPCRSSEPVMLSSQPQEKCLLSLNNGHRVSAELDLLFPLIHGVNGEDGSLQALAQLNCLACSGSSLRGSALSIDKELTKRLLHDHHLPIVPFLCLNKGAEYPTWKEAQEKLCSQKIFVKPVDQGSSIGTQLVSSEEQWQRALDEAFSLNTKILLEQVVVGREIEFALLEERGELRCSPAGEIILNAAQFYDYQQKYDEKGCEIRLNVDLTCLREMQEAACKAFTILQLSGYARIDFFLLENGKFFINEANSIPGFTSSSMFPLLWKEQGMALEDVLQIIIEEAMLRKMK